MKVSWLKASEVFGYLPISIEFDSHLTFLTGLNGSGKTTALRLLMGLLAPSIDELIDIKFASVEAVVSDDEKEISIQAGRSKDGLTLAISSEPKTLTISDTDIRILLDARRREEHHSATYVNLMAHPVIAAIRILSTPMFLGLDRRLHLDEGDASLRLRRRPLDHRLHFPSSTDVSIRKVTDSVLLDVNDLVFGALADIRTAQEQLDEKLRNQILLDSFKYEVTGNSPTAIPARAVLNRFRTKQAAFEKAAAGLRLPAGELQLALTQFFERMTRVVDAVENEQTKAESGKKTSKKKKSKTSIPEPPPQAIVEWLFNSRQAERIFKQIELFDEYVTNRAKLHQPMDRFIQLTNDFLSQTGKQVTLSGRGDLRVRVNDTDSERGLFALSSGERQLIVMLAHLSLNKRLAESGVFIVDEPELSLHINWQEQFVVAIQRANPNVQLILATHAPAIILERIDNCRTLSK